MSKMLRKGTYVKCSEGVFPAQLQVGDRATRIGGAPAADVLNLGVQFGACRSMKNPMVIEARGAPQPCIPLMNPPIWSEAKGHVLIKGRPAIHDGCTLTCQYEGEIEVIPTNLSHVEIGG